jgi:hypothetical protein
MSYEFRAQDFFGPARTHRDSFLNGTDIAELELGTSNLRSPS